MGLRFTNMLNDFNTFNGTQTDAQVYWNARFLGVCIAFMWLIAISVFFFLRHSLFLQPDPRHVRIHFSTVPGVYNFYDHPFYDSHINFLLSRGYLQQHFEQLNFSTNTSSFLQTNQQQDKKEHYNEICTICHEVMAETDCLFQTKCKHWFHKECITGWAERQKQRPHQVQLPNMFLDEWETPAPIFANWFYACPNCRAQNNSNDLLPEYNHPNTQIALLMLVSLFLSFIAFTNPDVLSVIVALIGWAIALLLFHLYRSVIHFPRVCMQHSSAREEVGQSSFLQRGEGIAEGSATGVSGGDWVVYDAKTEIEEKEDDESNQDKGILKASKSGHSKFQILVLSCS